MNIIKQLYLQSEYNLYCGRRESVMQRVVVLLCLAYLLKFPFILLFGQKMNYTERKCLVFWWCRSSQLCIPPFHWGPVLARTARGIIYAWTQQLLFPYLLVPEVCGGGLEVSGSSWKERSKREGERMGELICDGYPECQNISLQPWLEDDQWERDWFGWLSSDVLKGRNKQGQQWSILPLLSWNSAHGALHREGCTTLCKTLSPGRLEAHHCLQTTSHLSLLSLPLLSACLIFSSGRLVNKYRQDVFLVVVSLLFPKIFPVGFFFFSFLPETVF